MFSAVEVAANLFNTASIVLAARNSVHTWWTGICGCLLFMQVFFGAKLYADVTLQAFFILTSVVGWWRWRLRPGSVLELPIRRTPASRMGLLAAAGVVATLSYGWLLHRFTDAFAPVLDSVVLVFSVVGQLLLVARRLETWWLWLLVNTIAVPLYCSRGLYVTAALYVVFWVNAIVALRRWRRMVTG